MSIIAVKGIPLHWNIRGVLVTLAPDIKGPFEGMGPFAHNENKTEKICYIKLADTLHPIEVVERINARRVYKDATLHAYIATNVPSLKRKGLSLPGPPLKIKFAGKFPKRRKFSLGPTKIPFAIRPEMVVLFALRELLIELQCKFTSLYEIAKENPELMPEIAKIILERLKTTMDTSLHAGESSLILSKIYRKMYPHLGDFELIVSTLHRVQDEAGVPRKHFLEERELSPVPKTPFVIDNVPLTAVKASYLKHSLRISKKMVEHIKNMKCDLNQDTDSEVDKARKKVREELKKYAIYMPWVVNQAVITHIMPNKNPTHRIRVYGEPKMPKMSLLHPLLKSLSPFRMERSNRIYNMIQFNVQPMKHDQVMSLDGSHISGCKLTFRVSDTPVWEIPDQMKTEIAEAFGADDVDDFLKTEYGEFDEGSTEEY